MRILQGDFKDGDKVKIDCDGKQLIFLAAGQIQQQEDSTTAGVLH